MEEGMSNGPGAHLLSLYLMATGLPLRSNSAKIELSAKLFDVR